MLHRRTWAAIPLSLACAASSACASGHAPVAAQRAPPAHRLSGEVLAVDADTRSLTLLDAGRIYEVSYDSETIFRRGSAEVPAATLRTGDRIIVSLHHDRAWEARLIGVAGPAPGTPAPRGVVP